MPPASRLIPATCCATRPLPISKRRTSSCCAWQRAGWPHEGILLGACAYVEGRKDCSDFVLHALLRLLYQFNVHPRLSPHLYERVFATVLGFKYWPDEPGEDSMCTWTENHQILFASAAYLAGQHFPDERFSNSGQSGHEKMAQARPRILRWLDLRERTGFSEWLSNVYYDEDLTALLSLLDFCEDAEMREKARRVIDLILLDIALNSFRGVFGSTHGRSYAIAKMQPAQEATSALCKLLFGMGSFSSADTMSAACCLAQPGVRAAGLASAHRQCRASRRKWKTASAWACAWPRRSAGGWGSRILRTAWSTSAWRLTRIRAPWT